LGFSAERIAYITKKKGSREEKHSLKCNNHGIELYRIGLPCVLWGEPNIPWSLFVE
jgi:hypothetical protein